MDPVPSFLWLLVKLDLENSDDKNFKIFCEVEQKLTADPELLKVLRTNDLKLIVRKAVLYDRKKIIELITKYKSDFNTVEFSIIKGDLKSAEKLLSENQKLDWDWKFPVSEIFDKKDTRKKIMQLLFKYRQLDPGFRNELGENLLHVFIKFKNTDNTFTDFNDIDNVEVAKILIDAGVSCNEGNRYEYTPLHYSINRENIPATIFLLNNGAEVNQKNKYQRNILHYTVRYVKNEIIVDLLLAKGVEINAASVEGSTALHEACYNYCEKIISLLMRKGADISPMDRRGNTPFSLLSFDESEHDASVRVMIKEFSKMSFENLDIHEKDANRIQKNLSALEYLNQCTAELNQLAKTKFYASFSYYSILQMSKKLKKLAKLTKNEDFVTNFKTSLKLFPNYESDLQEIFEDALQIRDKIDAVQSRLSLVFGDFLPFIVILKLTKNLCLEDLPLE